MKNKKLIITLCIVFLFGISSCFIGVVLKGATAVSFVFDKGAEFITAQEPSMKTEYISNDTKIIDFDIDASSVKIISGDNFSINYDEKRYEVNMDNNKISVSQINNAPMFQFGFDFNYNFDIDEIILTIPESTVLNELNLNISASNLKIENIIADKVDVCSGVGDIDIEHCNFTNTKLTTDVGDVYIKNSEFLNLEIISDLGDIKIDDSIIENKITADVDLGDVEIKDSAIKKMADFDLNLGNLELDLIGILENYSIKADIDLGKFELNGDDYRQDYYFTSSTNNENLIDIKLKSGNCELNFN